MSQASIADALAGNRRPTGAPALTRREFLQLSALSSAAVLTGCATNPVTGQRELMLFNQDDEIRMDREACPHQFSADYGAVRDARLNAYLSEVGRGIAANTHRPGMPYSFRGVNASYVNAYAFPGGSIAATRGILLDLDNEAELAALLGHEIGHVNARHTAHAMSKNALITGGLAIAAAVVGQSERYKDYSPLVLGLGGVGAGLLLARYSRDDERQADQLGMEYLTRAGHNPDGMIGLMEKLRALQKDKPNALDLMFATHPMSDERYRTAVARAQADYAAARSRPLNRERYQDSTAELRKIRAAVESIQRGDEQAGAEKWQAAEEHYANALRQAPDDYEALLKRAQSCLRQQKTAAGRDYALKARAVYPDEPHAWHVCGLAELRLERYDAALQEFTRYDAKLPGNAFTAFYKGRALDGLGRKADAAPLYRQFLQENSAGAEADYARERLNAWGLPLPQ